MAKAGHVAGRGKMGGQLKSLWHFVTAMFVWGLIGDVNTAVAAALVAARRALPVVHLEAGLRSRCWEPEEINRRMITACSSYHLAPSELAVTNLLHEGIGRDNIFTVGNTMAETFLRRAEFRQKSEILSKLKLHPRGYFLVTVHKPSTLARPEWLMELLAALALRKPVVLPCHPRTRPLFSVSTAKLHSDFTLLDPLPYDDFGCLLENSFCVVTDSDGTQEESTMVGVPCFTIRPATARPETVLWGSNHVVGFDIELCLSLVESAQPVRKTPKYWDAYVSCRIADALMSIVSSIRAEKPEELWHIR